MDNMKHIRQLARSVGAQIKATHPADGVTDYILVDKHGDHIAVGIDSHDMLDSIEAYYGTHPEYSRARAEYDYQTN